jgi:hypothetical protein
MLQIIPRLGKTQITHVKISKIKFKLRITTY